MWTQSQVSAHPASYPGQFVLSELPEEAWNRVRQHEAWQKMAKKSQIILDENPLFSATITEYFGLVRLIHLFRASLDRFNIATKYGRHVFPETLVSQAYCFQSCSLHEARKKFLRSWAWDDHCTLYVHQYQRLHFH